MYFTISASSGTISKIPLSPLLYPSSLPVWQPHFAYLLRSPHFIFLLMFQLPSCAIELNTVISISPFYSRVFILSSLNHTPIFLSFNIRIHLKESNVFLAKRLKDFTSIRSTFSSHLILLYSQK